MNTPNIKHRFAILDLIRGIAVVLMIFFHTCFDLNFFGFLNIDILHGQPWHFLPRLIVFLFLFSVGYSLVIVHGEHIKWKMFFYRIARLAFFAIIISLSTYFLYPEHWIYFGTLHAITVISLFTLPFLKHPNLSLLIALALFIPSIFFQIDIPWYSLPHQSWDYIEPFPWLGASLFGVFASRKKLHKINIPENKITDIFVYLGKHSLVIYLIHQPILFSLVYGIKLLVQ